MQTEVDVIIPCKTSSDSLKRMAQECITSLRHSETDYKFNVVVIESQKDYPRYLDPWYLGQDSTIVWEKPEFNYNGALNLGIASTKNEWVVLANNDLLFHKGWFTEILKIYSKYPSIHSFSSWTSYWQWHDQHFQREIDRVKKADAVLGYTTIGELAAWCLTTRRELLEKITLHESVDFYYSDVIYADELLKIGMPHALVVNSRVDHLAHKTLAIEPNVSRLENAAQKLKYDRYATEEVRINRKKYEESLGGSFVLLP